MSFHHFAEALQDGFFHGVAGSRAIVFIDEIEPVDGNPLGFVAGQIPGNRPTHGEVLQECLAQHQRGSVIAKGEREGGGRNGSRSHLTIIMKRKRMMVNEGKEAEAFDELHERTGFRLNGRGPFAHLFFGAGEASGVFPAKTEIDRNIESSGVDAFRFGQGS